MTSSRTTNGAGEHASRDQAVTRREFLGATGAFSAGVLGSTWIASPVLSQPSKGRLVVDGLDTSIVNDDFLKLVRKGGAHCVHKSMGSMLTFDVLHEFVDARDEVLIAGTVAEIREAHRDGKISFVCGAQAAGGPFSSNEIDRYAARQPLGSLRLIGEALGKYYERGLRIQGLCYNTYNIFGSGCLDHTVPLTRAGRHLVEEIHRHGIVLDVGGHTGERTSLDAIEVSSGSIAVCTHTNFAALNHNMRCISDRLAEAIARTGGVIGLTSMSDFLVRNPETAKAHGPRSPRASLDLLLDQYDYGKRLVGVEHMALGPDFIWGWAESLPMDPEDSIAFPPFSKDKGVGQTVEGYDNISELPNLIDGLRDRGWSESELDLMLGENWLRVFEKVWGG